MKNLKLYENNMKKRIGAIVLSVVLGATTLGLSGCAKESKDDSKEQVTYTVEDANDNHPSIHDSIFCNTTVYARLTTKDKDAVYENYVDIRELPENSATYMETSDMLDMTEEELNATNYKIDYVCPVRELNLSSAGLIENIGKKYKSIGSTIFERESDATFPTCIVPNCYKWAEDLFGKGFNKNLSTINYSVEELDGKNGNAYVNYDFNITFNEDIDVPNNDLYLYNPNTEFCQKYGMQKDIKKGDTLNYKALYIIRFNSITDRYKKENLKFDLLADEQTGMGADSDNVVNGLKHNYNDVYKSISSLGREKEDKTFNNMDEFEDFVFYPEKTKSRK